MIRIGLKDPEISENEQFFREFRFALYLSTCLRSGALGSPAQERNVAQILNSQVMVILSNNMHGEVKTFPPI